MFVSRGAEQGALLRVFRYADGYHIDGRFKAHATVVVLMSEDPRLARLSEIARALPETVRQVAGHHAAFLVRKRTFAYFLDDHHGDGIVALACKVLPGDNAALAAARPRRFYLPAYIASRGWVALRLDVGKIDWGEVTELVRGSYILIAPKRLVERVEGRC
jgi:hypothetical protein